MIYDWPVTPSSGAAHLHPLFLSHWSANACIHLPQVMQCSKQLQLFQSQCHGTSLKTTRCISCSSWRPRSWSSSQVCATFLRNAHRVHQNVQVHIHSHPAASIASTHLNLFSDHRQETHGCANLRPLNQYQGLSCSRLRVMQICSWTCAFFLRGACSGVSTCLIWVWALPPNACSPRFKCTVLNFVKF